MNDAYSFSASTWTFTVTTCSPIWSMIWCWPVVLIGSSIAVSTVTEPGACSFCIMLALRHGKGMLYPAKRAASFKAHRKRANGAGGECRCHAEPVFTEHEPSHRMRTMQALWDESTKGRRGKDAQVAFRQAVEGREVTGTTGAKAAKPKTGTAAMSRAQLEQQIALTEGLKDSPWRTRQLERLRGELAKRK